MDINNIFTYHSPDAGAGFRSMKAIRNAGRSSRDHHPGGNACGAQEPDSGYSFGARKRVMTANAAIAL